MGNKINSVGLTSYRLGSHAYFHEKVDDVIAKYDAAVLGLEELAPLYAVAVANELAIVNRPTAFYETPQIEVEDHKRSMAVSLIFNHISAELKSTIEAEVAAAQRLHAIVAPYHGCQKHDYTRETTELQGLEAALATAKPEDIASVGLASAIAQLKMHNEAFDKLYVERLGDIGTRMPISTTDTQEVRHIVDGLFHRIADRVNAMSELIPSPDVEAFIVAVNSIILQYKHVAGNQHKSAHTDSEETSNNEAEVNAVGVEE